MWCLLTIIISTAFWTSFSVRILKLTVKLPVSMSNVTLSMGNDRQFTIWESKWHPALKLSYFKFHLEVRAWASPGGALEMQHLGAPLSSSGIRICILTRSSADSGAHWSVRNYSAQTEAQHHLHMLPVVSVCNLEWAMGVGRIKESLLMMHWAWISNYRWTATSIYLSFLIHFCMLSWYPNMISISLEEFTPRISGLWLNFMCTWLNAK